MNSAEPTRNEILLSIWEHINELRKRLFVAVLAFFVCCGIAFNFTSTLLEILARPLEGGINALVAIEVTENMGVFLRVSLLTGFIFSLPILLYELMAFIAPGLTESEQKWVYIFIPFATIMFVGGVAFTYYVMLPAAIPFLVNFLGIKTTPRLSNYVEFTTGLMFWIGVCFEMPLVAFLLGKLRLITAGTLARGWRYAIVGSAIAAAIITPTADPFNMFLLMLPLMSLYMMSILMVMLARAGEK